MFLNPAHCSHLLSTEQTINTKTLFLAEKVKLFDRLHCSSGATSPWVAASSMTSLIPHRTPSQQRKKKKKEQQQKKKEGQVFPWVCNFESAQGEEQTRKGG